MIDSRVLNIHPEVEQALAANRPVVALESTVIAHGLPRPQNLETARRVEQVVRDAGAVPATIAILDGKICVGLDDEKLKGIAAGHKVRKVSTRDLPVAIARRWNGATTVATSIWVAYRAGIRVLATGGIGGVHRQIWSAPAQRSGDGALDGLPNLKRGGNGSLQDVSADLPELARTPMVVVCSGPKSLVDIIATREWLETHGITVAGYQCDEMPAFYSRQSGLPIDVRCNSADEIVQLVKAQRALETQAAMLVTVPVPAEAEVAGEILQAVLNEASSEAERAHITGPDLTPFLLSRAAKYSKGATLRANIALLENNARVATEIARALV